MVPAIWHGACAYPVFLSQKPSSKDGILRLAAVLFVALLLRTGETVQVDAGQRRRVRANLGGKDVANTPTLKTTHTPR